MDSLPIRTAVGPLASPLARARVWVEKDPGARKRAASMAARDRDEEVLCDLMLAWGTLNARQKGGLSEGTRKSYRTGVRCLLKFAAESATSILRPGGTDWARLYVQSLNDSGLEPSSVRVRLAAAKKLYSSLRWAGATTEDPFHGVAAPKDPTAPMDKCPAYSEQELEALLRTANVRDRLSVLLGAHAGLRISEAAELIWNDIDLDRQVLLVRNGKGDKSREVIVSGTLILAFRPLLQAAAGVGESVLGLKTRGLRSAFERLCVKAAVKPRGFHALRHSAGTRLYEQLGDLGGVADHLGHASVDTARRYAKRSKALRDAIETW
jgi:integrase